MDMQRHLNSGRLRSVRGTTLAERSPLMAYRSVKITRPRKPRASGVAIQFSQTDLAIRFETVAA